MNTKEHKNSFDAIYRRRKYGSKKIKFPLAETEKIEWNRGKWGKEYYGYYYRRFTCHILSRLNIENGNKILVIGCGAGGDEKNLKSLYPWLKIYSIDISEEMVKKAIANLSPSNFMVSLAEALPFKSSTFDRILSREVIEHVIDPQMMLHEISRVLKPGGIVVITTENEESLSPKNYYEDRIKVKLAKIIKVPLPKQEYKDEAPTLSEMKIYANIADLDLIEYFWDGALYKSLLGIWKRIKKFLKIEVSSWAHWFSCLENNRILAYWFCDQAKYVFKNAKHIEINVASDSYETYRCFKCNGSLQRLSDDRTICSRCGKEFIIVNGLVYFKYRYNKDLNQTKKGSNVGKLKKIILKYLNNVLSTIYTTLYFIFALICTVFAKKNNRQLSHLMAPDDIFQKYLRKN